jgi:hypothetical protein
LAGPISAEDETAAIRTRSIVGHLTTSGDAPVSYRRLLKQWEESQRFARRNSIAANSMLALQVAEHQRNQMRDFALEDTELFELDWTPLHPTDSLNASLTDAILEDYIG